MTEPRVITLEEAKLQLKLTDRQTHHDEELETLRIPAAEAAAEQFLNRTLESLDRSSPPGGTAPYDVQENIKAGILLLLEIGFARDPKTMELYQKSAENLLFPYRLELGV